MARASAGALTFVGSDRALPVRAGTLVLRYEDLAAGNRETLAAISTSIGQPLLRGFDVSFERLHALYPAFSRRGSDTATIAELEAAATRLFEQQSRSNRSGGSI